MLQKPCQSAKHIDFYTCLNCAVCISVSFVDNIWCQEATVDEQGEHVILLVSRDLLGPQGRHAILRTSLLDTCFWSTPHVPSRPPPPRPPNGGFGSLEFGFFTARLGHNASADLWRLSVISDRVKKCNRHHIIRINKPDNHNPPVDRPQ